MPHIPQSQLIHLAPVPMAQGSLQRRRDRNIVRATVTGWKKEKKKSHNQNRRNYKDIIKQKQSTQ